MFLNFMNKTTILFRYSSQYIFASCLLFLVFSCSAQTISAQTNTEPSLDEKIGQMLMVGFKGFEIQDSSHVVRDIQQYHVGSIILFDFDVPSNQPIRNIDTPEQVRRLNNELQKLGGGSLFIAVDQEGGRVARLKPRRGFKETRSAQHLGDLNNIDSTRYYASEQAQMLHDLGFSVNFAPVVDLNTNPKNPVIGSIERSFSENPEIVTKHAAVFLEEFNKAGIIGILKHFPGHGSSQDDSHLGLTDVTDTWDEIELEPYENLVNSGHSFGVMTAHVFNENLDTEVPATLSKKIQTDLLRNEIGFTGILFSDDMQMEAIRSYYGLEEAVKRAIQAGVDILVFGNNSVYERDIIPQTVRIIRDLIQSGEISENRIDQSYQRIMNAKKTLLE